MNIYVDELYDTPMGPQWNYAQAGHLFALPGDEEALKDFGELMELNQDRWKPNDVVPHWELSPLDHQIAIDAGAKLVSRAGMAHAVKLWRAHRALLPEVKPRKRGKKP
jgi:hypothetical protein